MKLSRREKIIGLVTLAAVGLFAGDRLLLSPLLQYRADLARRAQALEARVAESQQALQSHAAMQQRWRDMQTRGLATEAAQAEAQMLRSLNQWASQAGLSVQAITPEQVGSARSRLRARPGAQPESVEMVFRIAAIGNMRSISGFLTRLQNPPLPLRVKDVQITSRREAADDLSLLVTLATVYMPDAPDSSAAPAAPAALTLPTPGARYDAPEAAVPTVLPASVGGLEAAS